MTFSDFFYKDLHSGDNRKYLTDKGDVHNYINGYYSTEFTDIKEKPINILEIGIAQSGSLKLWRDWFTNANIYAIEYDRNLYKEIPGVGLIIADGYSEDTIKLFDGIEFDYIIDDGPHTIQSQIYSVKNWVNKLKIGGKLIVEDIQNFDHISLLKENTLFPNRVIDLRDTLHKRYDDVIFEITKTN